MNVFDYRSTKNDQVFISYQGRDVTTLRGAAAGRFLDRVRAADEEGAQQVMARLTGDFKRGNER